MELRFDKKTLRNIALWGVGVIIIYWLLHDADRVDNVFGVLAGIFSPFVIGSVLAFILNVPMRAFEKLFQKIKQPVLRRAVALLLTLLCVILVLALVFVLLIPELIVTVKSIEPKLTAFFSYAGTQVDAFLSANPNVKLWITENLDLKVFDWASLAQKLFGFISSSLNQLFPQAVSAIGTLFSAMFGAFISVAFALYSLFQKETLARQGRKIVYAILPEKVADYIVRILRLSNSTFSNFLSGQCVEVCILGSMFAVTMAIFRMPYIPLISVLVAVTAFIPVVGAWTGCIVGAFLIFVSNPVQAIWFVVMFIVLQQIENNLIYPRVVGTSIGLSGMWVLVAVSIGGEFMGVAGMFLMIPFVSVLYALLREIVNNRLTNHSVPEEKLQPQPPELVSHYKEKRKKNKEKFILKRNERKAKKNNP